MGRPRKQDDTVVISANGKGAAWNPSVGFIGDEPLAQRAKTAATYAMVVTVHPFLEPVTASAENPLGAYAALSWAAGGRDLIVQAPAVVTDYLDSATPADEDSDICPDGQIEVWPEFEEVV